MGHGIEGRCHGSIILTLMHIALGINVVMQNPKCLKVVLRGANWKARPFPHPKLPVMSSPSMAIT